MEVSKRLAAALFFLSWTHIASAQTADEVVERCLTAAGGRAALAKDGLKVAFRLVATSSVQNYTITFTKVEHNQSIDPAIFSKPGV